jgi:hypothetical protein
VTMPGPGASSHLPDPPRTVSTMRMIGIVWMVVGGLAVIGGALGTVFAVVLFGVLAILLGAGLYALQQVRAHSAERSARTLSNIPPPPAAAPASGPLGEPPPPVYAPEDDDRPAEPEEDRSDAAAGSEDEDRSGAVAASDDPPAAHS